MPELFVALRRNFTRSSKSFTVPPFQTQEICATVTYPKGSRVFELSSHVHKRGKLYYLTYASMDKSVSDDELISYATAPSVTGPWTYRGEISGPAENSFTIHPGIVEFKGNWYFFYHDGKLTVGDQPGGLGRRAVAVEHLYYGADGSILPIVHTAKGVSVPRHR